MSTLAPIHPGEVLLEDFLIPLDVTQHHVAIAIGVPPRRINEIVRGKRRITAGTALRLACYFGTTDRFWLNLQTRYDLEVEKDHLGTSLDQIEPLRSACATSAQVDEESQGWVSALSRQPSTSEPI